MPSWKKVAVSGSDASFNSLYVTNAVTASIFSGSFIGDGAGLTNLTYGDFATASFTSQATWSFAHNIGYQYVAIEVFDQNNFIVIPSAIKIIDSNNVDIYFTSPQSGTALATLGTGVVTTGGGGTANTSSLLVTASAANNVITFTKGDSSTFNVSIDLVPNAINAIYADTASYVSASNIDGTVASASYAVTASYLEGYISPFPYTGTAEITGSLIVTSGVTASLFGTASWANNALTASYVQNAQTASYVENAQTASYVLQAVSASFASTASFVTASNVFGPYGSNSVITASYALTSSYSQNLQISGSVNNVDYIDFNTGSAIPAWKSGRVFWDNIDGALSVYNAEADITLQVGQENWTRVSNRTGTTITNGTVVRLIGAHGDVPEVERAQSLLVSGSVNVLNQILGVATHDIEDNSAGFITTQGLVRGLNTNAFNDGDTLFVGTGSSGILQNTPPIAPYEIIPVGVCVKSGPGGSGIIYVAVQEPIDFSDLSSAKVDGIYHYGDLWTYVQSGSVGVWTHTNQLSGSYGLTGSLSATEFTGSLQGTASFATSASQAISSSYAISASYSISASQAITASHALTASYVNTLTQDVTIVGNQIVTGSMIVTNNFTVLGSASIQYISESVLNIGTNLITVNTFAPSTRFGGLAVIDSGSSPSVSASFLYDSVEDEFIFVHKGDATSAITSSHFLLGPETYNDLGNETYLMANRIPKGTGIEHLRDSNITDTGTIVSINSNTIITGSLTISGSVISPQGNDIDSNALIQASLLYLSNNF